LSPKHLYQSKNYCNFFSGSFDLTWPFLIPAVGVLLARWKCPIERLRIASGDHTNQHKLDDRRILAYGNLLPVSPSPPILRDYLAVARG
jgi:hypothetical protein